MSLSDVHDLSASSYNFLAIFISLVSAAATFCHAKISSERKDTACLDITLTETDSIKTFFNLDHPPIVHFSGLLAYVAITLGFALWRVQSSQFAWQSEL